MYRAIIFYKKRNTANCNLTKDSSNIAVRKVKKNETNSRIYGSNITIHK